ncbi:MAG: hypothetical protein M1399_02225 [Actinobacteria bacterium]|nr:hypothetical protein [Actinomycetota bacterium]
MSHFISSNHHLQLTFPAVALIIFEMSKKTVKRKLRKKKKANHGKRPNS